MLNLQGCDFSGIVEEIGSDVKSDVKKGDRIFGFVQGCNNINLAGGAFAEYLLAKDGIFAKVPDFMSMEDAATLGVGVVTVGQVLKPSCATELYWCFCLSNFEIGILSVSQTTTSN